MKTTLNSKNLSRAIVKLGTAHLAVVIAIWVFVTPPLKKEDFNLDLVDFRKYFHRLFYILFGLGMGSLGKGKHNWSSMLFCLILSCFCAEIYILSKFLLEWLTSGIRLAQTIQTFSFQSVIQGFGLSSMLILAFYPTVGKISILATARFMAVVSFMYLLLESILSILQVYDPLSLITINFFGGICGVAVSTFLKDQIQVKKINNGLLDAQIKQVLSVIGSFFLLVYTPFLVGDFTLDVQPLYHKHQAAVNSILAISLGSFTAYYTTYFLYQKPKSSDAFVGAMASFVCSSALSGMRMNHSLVMSVSAVVGIISSVIQHDSHFRFLKGVDERKLKTVINEQSGKVNKTNIVTKANQELQKQYLNAKNNNWLLSKVDIYDPSMLISSTVLPSFFSLVVQSICLIVIHCNPHKYASLILTFPSQKQYVNNIVGLIVACAVSIGAVMLIKYSVSDYFRNKQDFEDQDQVTTLVQRQQIRTAETKRLRTQFQNNFNT